MPEILLINPSPRPSKRKRKPSKSGATKMAKVKKRRTAAQRAATARLVALNKRRRNPAKRKSTKRRRNPVGALTTLAANPIRKRRRVHASPKRIVRRRRNPIKANMIMGVIKPAAIQAGGGLGLNLIMSFLTSYLPDSLKTGPGRSAIELAVAVGIGAFGGKVVSRGLAKDLAQGAATITMYNLAKTSIQKASPEIGARLNGYEDGMDWELQGLGYYNNAVTFDDGMGELYSGQGMGELYDNQQVGAWDQSDYG